MLAHVKATTAAVASGAGCGNSCSDVGTTLKLTYFSTSSARDATELQRVDEAAVRQGVMLSVGVTACASGTHLIDNVLLLLQQD